MEKIELGLLSLVSFDKDNVEHLNFLKRLLADKTITRRFGGLLHMLINSTNGLECFNKGFFVVDNNEYVGYIDVGAYKDDEKAVYLRGAIVKEKRGLGYGSMMLSETSDYIFSTYPIVREVKLKTVDDNINAIRTIKSCGFKPIYGTLFSKKNPYNTKVKTFNYVSNNS